MLLCDNLCDEIQFVLDVSLLEEELVEVSDKRPQVVLPIPAIFLVKS